MENSQETFYSRLNYISTESGFFGDSSYHTPGHLGGKLNRNKAIQKTIPAHSKS